MKRKPPPSARMSQTRTPGMSIRSSVNPAKSASRSPPSPGLRNCCASAPKACISSLFDGGRVAREAGLSGPLAIREVHERLDDHTIGQTRPLSDVRPAKGAVPHRIRRRLRQLDLPGWLEEV